MTDDAFAWSDARLRYTTVVRRSPLVACISVQARIAVLEQAGERREVARARIAGHRVEVCKPGDGWTCWFCGTENFDDLQRCTECER